MLRKLQSRKFWALILAVVGIAAATMTGDMTVPDAIKALVAAAASYQIGEGIADSRRG